MSQYVFSLDIGTRTVNGILLKKEHDTYQVINHYSLEHKQRSMLDGQIHNIIDVANIIQQVKEQLETDEYPLTSVYVAAAGRSLKTMQATEEITLDQATITDEQMVRHLELSAVYQAQKALSANNDQNSLTNYHCVGYSVVHYKLDGERIGSLIDQRGKTASVEVIATFLPKIVVDSLVAALKRAGLTMEALTLEPIAAIQILVPESMRRLNIALVDIGAGTSDIAITDDGTVTAYGMVPLAGDEITEVLSDTYLLDYPDAELMKQHIRPGENYIVNDVLGFETNIHYDEFVQTIENTTNQLADAITSEIFRLNKVAPRAVMLIGGGSLTPNLSKRLAENLQLAENRVAVQSVDALRNITLTDDFPQGPDFITPIGIAVTAKEKPIHLLTASINEQEFKIFKMDRLTIGEAAVQANIPIYQYYGRPGQAYIISINGKEEIVPGTLGSPPKVWKNGEPTTIDELITDGDQITLEKGAHGKSPQITLEQYFGVPHKKEIMIDHKHVTIDELFYVNGQSVTADYVIQDNDTIQTTSTLTIGEFFHQQNHVDEKGELIVTVNDERIRLTVGQTISFLKDGKPVEHSAPIEDGDKFEVTHEVIAPNVQSLLNQLNKKQTNTIQVIFNGSPVELQSKALRVFRLPSNEELTLEDTIQPFDRIHIDESNEHRFIFQDIFRYVDVKIDSNIGQFSLKVNGTEATFFSPIQDGDELQLQLTEKST